MATIEETLALAVQYHQSGQFYWAEQLYRQILQVNPEHADTLCLLAGICMASGRLDEAVVYYQTVLRVRPYQSTVHSDLGIALVQLGRREEATACFRQAVSLDPQNSDAHNNLGIVLAEQGQLAEAAASYRESLRLKADNPGAYNNLGIVLRDTGHMEEALACFQEALRLKPDYAEAYNNQGIAFAKLGKFEEAAAGFHRSLQLRPNYPKALSNLGNALAAQGRLDEAVPHYLEALRLEPYYADAHRNLGIAWLLLGNLEHGWPEYEWRWQCQSFPPRPFVQPLWDGSPLGGRAILLHAEQGLGDAIQFIRYAPLVKERGGYVIVECPEGLLPLLSTCRGIDQLIMTGSPLPSFETHAALLSLPGIFRTTLETIRADIPYLAADPELREKWRQEILLTTHDSRLTTHGSPLRIGIAWQGNPQHPNDFQRSVALERFAPVARLNGVQLFSLQRGPGSEQLTEQAARLSIVDLGSRFRTFADTAAALVNLDLVVTVDSAVAHCAGALGVPVWVLLSFVPDWRWLLGRDDSPWYPTMRLFRQGEPGNWDGVFSRVVEALKK
jgi:Flp pilus assembly protein TadD